MSTKKLTPRLRQALFTIAAFLVAPLVAAFGIALTSALKNGVQPLDASDLAVWTLIYYVYATWAVVILGLPTFLLLRKLGAIRWWSASLVGFVAGILVLVLMGWRSMSALSDDPALSALWGSIGALSALAFWVIWRHGRACCAFRGT